MPTKVLMDVIKRKCIGTFICKDNAWPENGPKSTDVGYVLEVLQTDGDFGDRVETWYPVFYENFEGYWISFEGMGTYYPNQEALFTLDKQCAIINLHDALKIDTSDRQLDPKFNYFCFFSCIMRHSYKGKVQELPNLLEWVRVLHGVRVSGILTIQMK